MTSHSPSERPDERNSPAATTRELVQVIEELKHGLLESGVTGHKMEVCLHELSIALRQHSMSELRELRKLLAKPHAPLPQGSRALYREPVSAVETVSSALMVGLSRGNLGNVGCKANILPHAANGDLLILLSNQNSFTDSALIAHAMGHLAGERLVELTTPDSFPNSFTQRILQRGKSSIESSMRAGELLGSPDQPLAGSAVGALLECMRQGKWPLIFPEARAWETVDAPLHKSFSYLQDAQYSASNNLFAFRFSFLQPFLSDGFETFNIDPRRVQIIPVKVLYSYDLWNPRGCCPNEEGDTIVKFGRSVALTELRANYPHRGGTKHLRDIATMFRNRIIALGENYLDGEQGHYD